MGIITDFEYGNALTSAIGVEELRMEDDRRWDRPVSDSTLYCSSIYGTTASSLCHDAYTMHPSPRKSGTTFVLRSAGEVEV